MHLIRTVPPAVLPVSLAEVKAVAHLDGSEDDAKIAGLIRTAVEQIDGPDGEIQRALVTQSWQLRLDCFPGHYFYRGGISHSFRWRGAFYPTATEIEIPLPPLQAVESITYTTGGVAVTMDPAEYVVAGVGDRWKARIRHVIGWPSADYVAEAVTIEFRCGYGDSWNDVPESIRTAIIGRVQELYDGCASGVPEKLLAPYRVDFGFA